MAYINTATFAEVYSTEQSFVDSFRNSAYTDYIEDDKYLKLTYALLFAKYEESHIASFNSASFENKVNSFIFQYAPNWIKELEIQQALRSLTEEDITKGSIAKFTHGYNPSTVPGTGNSDTEIETVNEQTLNKYTKSKLDGYTQLMGLLLNDVTQAYISKFSKLFMKTIDVSDLIAQIEENQDE